MRRALTAITLVLVLASLAGAGRIGGEGGSGGAPLSTSSPVPVGDTTGTAGTATDAARADHDHVCTAAASGTAGCVSAGGTSPQTFSGPKVFNGSTSSTEPIVKIKPNPSATPGETDAPLVEVYASSDTSNPFFRALNNKNFQFIRAGDNWTLANTSVSFLAFFEGTETSPYTIPVGGEKLIESEQHFIFGPSSASTYGLVMRLLLDDSNGNAPIGATINGIGANVVLDGTGRPPYGTNMYGNLTLSLAGTSNTLPTWEVFRSNLIIEGDERATTKVSKLYHFRAREGGRAKACSAGTNSCASGTKGAGCSCTLDAECQSPGACLNCTPGLNGTCLQIEKEIAFGATTADDDPNEDEDAFCYGDNCYSLYSDGAAVKMIQAGPAMFGVNAEPSPLCGGGPTPSGQCSVSVANGWLYVASQGVQFAAADTNQPTCSQTTDYFIWADLSDGKLKKCQGGVATDLQAYGQPGTTTASATCNLTGNPPSACEASIGTTYINAMGGSTELALWNNVGKTSIVTATGSLIAQGGGRVFQCRLTDDGTEVSVVGVSAQTSSYNEFVLQWTVTGNTVDADVGPMRVECKSDGGTSNDSFGVTINRVTFSDAVKQAEKRWFPAARCIAGTARSEWDTPSSGNAAVSCPSPQTNTVEGTLDFADASDLSAQTTFRIPDDWDIGTVTALLKWRSATTSGNVQWKVATACAADGEADDPSFNTANTTTDATKGTTNQLNDTSSVTLTMTGCAPGELLTIKVSRDAQVGNATDTMAGTANLRGVEIAFTRGA